MDESLRPRRFYITNVCEADRLGWCAVRADCRLHRHTDTHNTITAATPRQWNDRNNTYIMRFFVFKYIYRWYMCIYTIYLYIRDTSCMYIVYARYVMCTGAAAAEVNSLALWVTRRNSTPPSRCQWLRHVVRESRTGKPPWIVEFLKTNHWIFGDIQKKLSTYRSVDDRYCFSCMVPI